MILRARELGAVDVLVPLLRAHPRGLFAYDPSESVATGLDNNECCPQLFFRVAVQNTFQFLVHRVLSRRQDAKVQNSRTQGVDEDEPTKIPIPCDEEAILILGGPQ